MDEIVREFVLESYESLDGLERALVALERNPSGGPTVADVLRAVHNVKGTSSLLGFSCLEQLTHASEEFLARLGDGTVALTDFATDTLLETVDAARVVLRRIEASGGEGQWDPSALVQRLRGLPVFGPPLAGTGELARHAAAPRAGPTGGRLSGSSVRVDQRLLDRLVGLVGELLLVRDTMARRGSEDPDLQAGIERLDSVTDELRQAVTDACALPITALFSKFPRVVRDLAAGCHKALRLELEAPDAMLDRVIVEALSDPLTHLVRNAVDHGIESPELRVKSGKDPEGLLVLRAAAEDGRIRVEVADDGAGLDIEGIGRRAVEHGLATPGEAGRLTAAGSAELLFRLGFSSAKRVTTVSGRGVGLDVVRTNVGRLGGTVEVSSERGRGTTWRISVPMKPPGPGARLEENTGPGATGRGTLR